MAFIDFFKKARKKVGEELGDAGAAISKGFSSLGKIAKSYKQKASNSKVGAYFEPTERLRTRDFIRETPKAVGTVGKSLFGGTIEVAKTAPKIIGEGSAYALDDNVRDQYKKGNTEILPTISKVSPTKMLADTGRSLLEVGTLGRGPKWAVAKSAPKRIAAGSAIGYGFDVAGRASENGKLEKKDLVPGMNTLAGGLLTGLARPATQIVQEGIKDTKVAINDLKRLAPKARTQVIPATTERISREVSDATPGTGTFKFKPEGGVEKVDGFNFRHKEGKFDYPEQRIVEPWKPESGLLQGILKPGMRIESVTDKIAAKNAKAKALINTQIKKQKDKAPKAEEGFVMPEQVKPLKLSGNPEEDFRKSLDATTPPAPLLQTPKFNQYQEKAFQEKQGRIQAIKEISEAPTVLRAMGYKKKEAERFGIDEAKQIAELGKLGYTKMDLASMDFDRRRLVLKHKVPSLTLKEYDTRKRDLNTDFLKDVDAGSLKDISPLQAGTRDVYRNFEDVFGENYGKLKSELLDPFDAAKGEFIREQERVLAALDENIVKGLGIKKGSNLSGAVQLFGEGKMSLEMLKEKFPKDWDRVVKADQWFRKMYDEMLDETNRIREYYFPTHPLHPESTKVIPKRDNYYRHFREMQDGFKGLLNIFDSPANIDPSLAVSSEFTKPATKWLSFAQRRKGDQTEVDAVGGFLDYLKASAYAKHIDPFIQKFRGVDAEMAANAKKSHEFIDDSRIGLAEELSKKIDPMEIIAATKEPAKIKDILIEKGLQDRDAVRMSKELAGIKDPVAVREYMKANLSEEGMSMFSPAASAEASENKLNNFLKFLDNFSNDLAGKTNPLDRPFQDNVFGRQMFRGINWLNSRVKANTILGNVSSAVAQFFAIPQAAANAGPKNSILAIGDSLASIFKADAPVHQSDWMAERYFRGYDKFNPGILNSTRDFAVWMTSIGDKVGSTFAWNAQRRKGLELGVPDPKKYADDWTRKLVAGRGIGEVPILQKSKLTQLFFPFQLEVANQWRVFGDWAKDDPRKLAVASKLIQYSVYVWLMNRVAKEIRGSDVAFDPMEAMIDAYGSFNEEENKGMGALKAGGRLVGEVASNIPGGAIPASWYPEYGFTIGGEKMPTREDLFGDKDPTRFGGGLLVSKSLTDPLYMVAPPFGGRQIKSTIGGAETLNQGFAETESGRVMTPVESTPYNWVKGLLMGKNALQEVQDYRENEQTPLSEDQSEKFKLGIPGFYEGVMNSRAADKEKEALKMQAVSGESIEREGNLAEGVFQLKDGSFYVPNLRADTKSFKTQADATRAVQKEEFEDSDENFRDLGDIVLRKREDGTSYPQRKDVFTTSLLTAKMTGAKKSEDYEGWLEYASQQYDLLQKLIQDPTVDDLERAEFQNKMMTLEDDFVKFEEYGGAFKKGSKGKKLEEKFRYPLVDADLIELENNLPGGNRMGLTSGIPIRASKPVLVKSRKVSRKKINL